MTEQTIIITFPEVEEVNSKNFFKQQLEKKVQEEVAKEKLKWQHEEKLRRALEERNQRNLANEKFIGALFDMGISVLSTSEKSARFANLLRELKEPLLPLIVKR